jgi:hypothetical protein
VHVQAAPTRQLQNLQGENLAISHDHDEIRPESLHGLAKLWIACPAGLPDWQSKIFRRSFERWRFHSELTSLRPVRLGDHANNLIARITLQTFQGDRGNAGASKKENAQGERGFRVRRIVQNQCGYTI